MISSNTSGKLLDKFHSFSNKTSLVSSKEISHSKNFHTPHASISFSIFIIEIQVSFSQDKMAD